MVDSARKWADAGRTLNVRARHNTHHTVRHLTVIPCDLFPNEESRFYEILTIGWRDFMDAP